MGHGTKKCKKEQEKDIVNLSGKDVSGFSQTLYKKYKKPKAQGVFDLFWNEILNIADELS